MTSEHRSIPKKMLFRLRYIVLPLAIFLLSLTLAAYFYHLLPTKVAYHFKDGLPDRWMGCGAIITWMLAPQFFFMLLGGAIIGGTTKLSARFQQPTSRWAEKLLLLMGNMVVLPQIILGFAMLDIFSYNSYQVHLLPLWVFALIVMGLGGVILGIYLAFAIREVWGRSQGKIHKMIKE
jgi:hypothetical protein